jgi:hypothetical protein
VIIALLELAYLLVMGWDVWMQQRAEDSYRSLAI